MVMNKQCVNRLWSVLLFEGYGALLPLMVSLIMSNRALLTSPKATNDIQSYLEHDFLPSITSISDVMKNLRILVAPNQATSRFFDIAYIKKLRSNYLMQHIQDFRKVEIASTSKANLLSSHLSRINEVVTAVDVFLQEVDRRIADIRNAAVNDPDVKTQLLRLERISLLFHGLSPHVKLMEKSAKKHLKLVAMRRVTMLDAIDTITTVNQSTYCLPDESQIAAVLENLHDSQLGIRLIGMRADMISVLLTVQTCIWNLVSVGWELHEMRLRKAHTEMSWVNSKQRESIQTKQDYLSVTYNRALGLDLTFADCLIRFLQNMKKELFGSAALEMSKEAKDVYGRLQVLWTKNSEEEVLGKELSDLIKQTGYKVIDI